MTGIPLGFPAQRFQAAFQSYLASIRADNERLREEAVTERSADVAGDLSGAIREVLDIEKRLADIKDYRESISLAGARADLAQNSLATLIDTAVTIASEATVAEQTGTPVALETASGAAGSAVATAVAALNVTIGDRSLFAGDAGLGGAITDAPTILAAVSATVSATATPADAVAALDSAFADPGGLFETVLYTGGTGDAPELEIAPGERLTYQARADDDAIRLALRGLGATAIAYDPDTALTDNQRSELFEKGLRDLRDATQSLARLSGSIGASEARIAEVSSALGTEETALTLRYNELAGVDGLTKAAELQFTEGQLERLFLTSARITRLSLANFL